jgi:hypothetical protein
MVVDQRVKENKMEKNCLIIAEQVSFRNDRLSILNVWHQFTALHLPAKFNFDLLFMCGPGWQAGEYNLTFKVKSEINEPVEIGSIKINIANEKSVFNAIASNLNFAVEKDSGDITFIVERDGEEIFEREYSVRYLLEMRNQPELAAVE